MDALRSIPPRAGYKKGDVLVIFGELFSKGYANGIVEEAERLGMTIVRSTVGRRDSDGKLRPLNEEEKAAQPEPFINIPLEAGYDMEPDDSGTTPCDQLKGIKMKDWDGQHLDPNKLKESKMRSIERFRDHTAAYMEEIKQYIPEGANVLFVHTMAGGVPRAKILMPVMNKVFKGRGDRFISSLDLHNSDLGKFAHDNFNEVTANTFKHLVDLSTEVRTNVESKGGKVSYVAYGYHGTETLRDGEYKWQTYTPYFQGWAKMALEKHCQEFMSQGISCCVFNCPEILTNSSSIFQGVEVSLYPLLGALQKEGENSEACKAVLDQCRSMIKDEHNFSEIMDFTAQYMNNELTTSHSIFEQWPQQNTREQMEYMLDSSDHLISMHKDPKELITFPLSEVVFRTTGQLMLHESWNLTKPVLWLNHDIVAKQLAQ